MNWFNDLISDNSIKSSARFLNVTGGVVLGGIFIADFILNKTINIDAFNVLALYYASVYTLGKTVSVLKGRTDVTN